MNLSKYNLNLLVAFDTLLKEQHVTRAGERLHLSQSAVSNILRQLRELFKDELFIRGRASRMIPTPRAMALAGPIREFVEKATLVITQTQHFDPKTAKRVFTIGMTDYAEFVIVPALVRLVMKEAPNIDLVIKHVNHLTDATLFENDIIDTAIGIHPKIPEKLVENVLFADEAVCVGCHKNKLLKKPPTVKVLGEAKHLLVLYYQSREELFSEQYFKKMGFKRRCVVTVPHTVSAIYTVSNTELIGLIMKRVALKVAENLPLTIQPAPPPWPKVNVSMVWHPKYRNDPAHQWLRQKIIEASNQK
jgi:DNA-binding transcriptional LysR family regulator